VGLVCRSGWPKLSRRFTVMQPVNLTGVTKLKNLPSFPKPYRKSVVHHVSRKVVGLIVFYIWFTKFKCTVVIFDRLTDVYVCANSCQIVRTLFSLNLLIALPFPASYIAFYTRVLWGLIAINFGLVISNWQNNLRIELPTCVQKSDFNRRLTLLAKTLQWMNL